MNQAGQRLGLDEEPLQQRGILSEPAGDHLDGDGSIEVGIVGLVHNSHAAASNDVDNVIFPDLCGQIGSHDVSGPNRGSILLVARHFAKTPGKRVSASLSRRPKTPAIVLRTVSGRNFDGNAAVPAYPAGVPARRAKGEDVLSTACKMPARESNCER